MPEVNESFQNEIKGSSPQKEKHSVLKGIIDYIELFVIAICVVLTLFSVAFRTCTVDGDSMNDTLIHQEVLIVSDLFYEPQREDIIVFHQTGNSIFDKNYPLVKRVIGVAGDTVKIDFSTWEVTVTDKNGNAVALDESYKKVDPNWPHNLKGVHEFSVPEGTVFVLGDNRNHSLDSTDQKSIGYVDTRRILGKVIIRVSPVSKFGTVK